jgi:hypothetical protein
MDKYLFLSSFFMSRLYRIFYWKKQRKKKYFLLFNCSNQRYQNKYIDLKPNPTIQLAHLSKPTKIAWEIHFIRKYKIATQIGMLLNAPLKKENDICRSGGQGEASSPCIYFRRSQQQLRITTAVVTTDHRCTCYAKTKKCKSYHVGLLAYVFFQRH